MGAVSRGKGLVSLLLQAATASLVSMPTFHFQGNPFKTVMPAIWSMFGTNRLNSSFLMVMGAPIHHHLICQRSSAVSSFLSALSHCTPGVLQPGHPNPGLQHSQLKFVQPRQLFSGPGSNINGVGVEPLGTPRTLSVWLTPVATSIDQWLGGGRPPSRTAAGGWLRFRGRVLNTGDKNGARCGS